jgi:hypothetical protein
MTKEEWMAACLADAPPFSEAQLAILRPVFRLVLPRITADAVRSEEASWPDAK